MHVLKRHFSLDDFGAGMDDGVVFYFRKSRIWGQSGLLAVYRANSSEDFFFLLL